MKQNIFLDKNVKRVDLLFRLICYSAIAKTTFPSPNPRGWIGEIKTSW